MIIDGTEASQHELSYDKIIKNTLEQSKEMTIRFINGLFNDDIRLDAPVEWLDKESVDDKYSAIVADFYPRIDGRMYAIEIEQDGSGDMAVRVFKYTIGGAMLHSMTSTKAELNITFPQPCVIFLSSTKNTPQELVWNIDFFDGQKVALKIPAIRLAELSVGEIAKRNLFPIGQFYLRTFETLNEGNIDSFLKTTEDLLTELKQAIDDGTVPYSVGVQMEDTIRKTFENVISRSEKEVGFVMTTDITETLPWTDYRDVFAKAEERGKIEGIAEGKAEGKAEGIAEGIIEGEAKGRAKRDMEIALVMFRQHRPGTSYEAITRTLKDLGVSNETIEAAYKQYKAEYSRKMKQHSEPER